ncbi:hypothetical protein [Aureimonas sp. AU20]|nr:hypothetical protein [Aureimonas sp. AU20]ALN73118.1 hypothetical protein M673_10325 [Aureimonas sp. AU20]
MKEKARLHGGFFLYPVAGLMLIALLAIRTKASFRRMPSERWFWVHR